MWLHAGTWVMCLDYRPEPFTAPKAQGGTEDVRFDYRIQYGSRAGETVILGLALHPNEGEWPKVAPHWLYLSRPDDVLAVQVMGSQSSGVVNNHGGEDGIIWMVTSAPPRDFRDQIETPGGKNMRTWLIIVASARVLRCQRSQPTRSPFLKVTISWLPSLSRRTQSPCILPSAKEPSWT